MERELSIRQRRFAAELAAGRSRAKAYAAAYPDQRMKKGTLEVEAKKAARHPKVQAEVARLTVQLLPPVEDMRAAYEHAFSTIVRLTIESPDGRLRFDAARWLRAECERQEQLIAESRPEPETERLLATLRAVYAKVMEAPAPSTDVSEAKEEASLLEEDGSPPWSSARLPPGSPPLSSDGSETASAITSAVVETEPIVEGPTIVDEATTPETSPEREVPPSPEFSRVPIPGRYPPKFRRVQVR